LPLPLHAAGCRFIFRHYYAISAIFAALADYAGFAAATYCRQLALLSPLLYDTPLSAADYFR